MPVKRLRRAGRPAIGLALMLAGCPFHEVGLVHPGDEGTVIDTEHGDRLQLTTRGDAAPLAFLDGHTTEVWGNRIAATVHVTDWKVTQGLHGMPAWVGVLDQRGVGQLGLFDRNSEAYYLIDADNLETLAPYIGETVLLEGYIDGAHRVKVMFYRVLEPGADAAAP